MNEKNNLETDKTFCIQMIFGRKKIEQKRETQNKRAKSKAIIAAQTHQMVRSMQSTLQLPWVLKI
jgi:hypothetical protein